MLEAIDRLHQADVAFLDQVEQRQPAIQVALGHRHDEAQVGLDQLPLGVGQRVVELRQAIEGGIAGGVA